MHSDFREMLRALNDQGVRYLVVGGYAVMEYTEPRYTKDLDVWIACDPENADATFSALTRFGAPLNDVTPADFTSLGVVYQMGVSPVRVDVLTSISGVAFNDAWERRSERTLGGIPVSVISLEDLITNKRAANRPQDRLDVKRLKAVL